MKRKLLLIASLVALCVTGVPANAVSAPSCATVNRPALEAAARTHDVGCVIEMVAAANGRSVDSSALRRAQTASPDDIVIICVILIVLAPGVPGVVDINAEGDTTIAVVGPFWDCPPYGDLFPPS